jgi:CIC family chloride channel protein
MNQPATDLRPAAALPTRGVGIAERLRGLVRGDEVWLAVVAAAVGMIAGLLVVVMNLIVALMHQLLFGLAAGDRLSASGTLPTRIGFLVPALGGLALAVIGVFVARRRTRPPVDPIEANALHGGAMSFRDSALVTAQTIISNGFGASVGLEAGYTQLASGIASKIGKGFRLRRADMRMLVGCGAAGAIAAAPAPELLEECLFVGRGPEMSRSLRPACVHQPQRVRRAVVRLRALECSRE